MTFSRNARLHLLMTIGFVSASIWPLANFINTNFSQLSLGIYGQLDDLYFFTVALVGFGLILSWGVGRIRPALSDRVFAVLAVSTFLVFTSEATRELVSGVFGLLGIAMGGVLLTIALITFLAGVSWFLSRFEPFRTAVGIASLVALLIPLSSLVFAATPWLLSAPDKVAEVRNAPREISTNSTGENIYYIVVDGYAGNAGMELIGHDNQPFIDTMAERGFSHDPTARSNYFMTHLSLLATLEANYIVTDKSPRYEDRKGFFPAALSRDHDPEAIEAIKASGYHAIRIGNWWAGCPDLTFERCFPKYNDVRSYAFDTFFQSTVFEVFLSREAILGAGNYASISALDLLELNFDEVTSAQPLFLFAHLLSPHSPYSRNADCSARAFSNADLKLPTDQKTSLYVDAVSCVNKQVLRVVDRIVRVDPTAVIVIQADHGASFFIDWTLPLSQWPKSAVDERASILSLARLPERCQHWNIEGKGQINTMRLLVACAQNRAPEFLPEETYISAYEDHSDFGLIAKAGY